MRIIILLPIAIDIVIFYDPVKILVNIFYSHSNCYYLKLLFNYYFSLFHLEKGLDIIIIIILEVKIIENKVDSKNIKHFKLN